MFGPNWRSNYEERIYVDGNDHYVRYLRGDGSFWSFGYSAANQDGTFKYSLVAPSNEAATLTENQAAGTWTVTLHNGEKRIFDRPAAPAAGMLRAIVDRNGNQTSLTYDGANRLMSVIDAAGRSLTFTYGNGQGYYYLVTGVTSGPTDSVSWSYAYDSETFPRLIKVTRPDTTYITFEYDAQSMVSAVRDMYGKVLETHTYDQFGRGTSSSRANGVDAITVSYPAQ